MDGSATKNRWLKDGENVSNKPQLAMVPNKNAEKNTSMARDG